MNELELRQMFKNLSDCYADTWLDIGTDMIQGEVIQAMTEDRFIEALKQAKLLVIPDVIKSVCLLGYSFEGCTYTETKHEACKYCDKFKQTVL
jgi:hypothetical protein